jgi:mandelate racemase
VSQVAAVRARPVDLPLRKPIETALPTLTTAPLVLVDVLTGDGLRGHSYASVYTPLVAAPLARLVENITDLLVGASAEPCDVEQALNRDFRLIGLQGLTGIAIAAIDMAIWDAKARPKECRSRCCLAARFAPCPPMRAFPAWS